jgi:uncharacterized protein (TIGR02145 family)
MWRAMALLFLTSLAPGLNAQQVNSRRFALVIGVQNYSSVPALQHSLNDAYDMVSVLKSKGFQVDFLYDPKTKKEIKEAVTRYYTIMRDQTGAVGIIYYAGHGTQYEGENYLIPANATLQVPGDLDDQCVKMNLVLSVLNSSGDNLNIFLLDACRTNKFPGFSRDLVKGLANVEAPRGSIVVFATQPGTVASDGAGKNGLFTSKLLKYINEPNLNIEEVFKRVKQEVNAESGGKQLPSVVDNSIGGDFYFTKAGNSPIADALPPAGAVLVNPESPIDRKEVSTGFDYGYGPQDADTVMVGSQTWISKNLNVTVFANGDPIPEAKTEGEWKTAAANGQPIWCHYNNDPRNSKIYGRLYNWYAANDPRGIAPKGWHVPSDEEWTVMSDYFGGAETAGYSLKSVTGWDFQGNGNNRSGIAGLPGGGRNNEGPFGKIGEHAYWWTSSESGNSKAWFRYLNYTNTKVNKLKLDKGCGFSIRVIKAPPLENKTTPRLRRGR